MEGDVTVGVGTIYSVVAGLLSAMALGLGVLWRVLQTTNEARIKAQTEANDKLVAEQRDRIAALHTRLSAAEAMLDDERKAGRAREERAMALLMEAQDQWGHTLDLSGAPRPSPSNRRRREVAPT